VATTASRLPPEAGTRHLSVRYGEMGQSAGALARARPVTGGRVRADVDSESG